MKKFEYKTEYINDKTDHMEVLNELGEEGWEVVNVKTFNVITGAEYLIKREVVEYNIPNTRQLLCAAK